MGFEWQVGKGSWWQAAPVSVSVTVQAKGVHVAGEVGGGHGKRRDVVVAAAVPAAVPAAVQAVKAVALLW